MEKIEFTGFFKEYDVEDWEYGNIFQFIINHTIPMCNVADVVERFRADVSFNNNNKVFFNTKLGAHGEIYIPCSMDGRGYWNFTHTHLMEVTNTHIKIETADVTAILYIV